MQLDVAYRLLNLPLASLRDPHWPKTSGVPGFYTIPYIFLAVYQTISAGSNTPSPEFPCGFP